MKLHSSRLVIFLSALVVAVLTARLGFWQLDRAQQKQALQDTLSARAELPSLSGADLAQTQAQALQQHYRRVQLEGQWQPASTVFLDNRQMKGRPGFFVITVFQLAQGGAVAVQRGWVARDAQNRTRLPPLPLPSGTVVIQGRVGAAPGRLYEFSSEPAGGVIRQNLDLAQWALELRQPLRPLSVQQLGDLNDGLLRQWEPPASGIYKHHGYAFQWFALCALTIGLYVWFQFIRPAKSAAP